MQNICIHKKTQVALAWDGMEEWRGGKTQQLEASSHRSLLSFLNK
jgi:hypothetical protein